MTKTEPTKLIKEAVRRELQKEQYHAVSVPPRRAPEMVRDVAELITLNGAKIDDLVKFKGKNMYQIIMIDDKAARAAALELRDEFGFKTGKDKGFLLVNVTP